LEGKNIAYFPAEILAEPTPYVKSQVFIQINSSFTKNFKKKGIFQLFLLCFVDICRHFIDIFAKFSNYHDDKN